MDSPLGGSPGMMPQQQAPQTVVEKQRYSVYTIMLLLSFIALCTTCYFFHWHLKRYESSSDWWDTGGARPIPAPTSMLNPGSGQRSIG